MLEGKGDRADIYLSEGGSSFRATRFPSQVALPCCQCDFLLHEREISEKKLELQRVEG